MNEYRNKKAITAKTYSHIQDVVEMAIASRATAFGWVDCRFYQAYPGGRLVDHTNVLPRSVWDERMAVAAANRISDELNRLRDVVSTEDSANIETLLRETGMLE